MRIRPAPGPFVSRLRWFARAVPTSVLPATSTRTEPFGPSTLRASTSSERRPSASSRWSRRSLAGMPTDSVSPILWLSATTWSARPLTSSMREEISACALEADEPRDCERSRARGESAERTTPVRSSWIGGAVEAARPEESRRAGCRGRSRPARRPAPRCRRDRRAACRASRARRAGPGCAGRGARRRCAGPDSRRRRRRSGARRGRPAARS